MVQLQERGNDLVNLRTKMDEINKNRKVKRKYQPGKQAPSDFFFEKENLTDPYEVRQ